jgi:hypothetical protein
VGSATISAAYSGDGTFAPSTSAEFSQVVNPASTTTALTVQPTSIIRGQTVWLRAHVAVAAPGIGLPTGSVQFRADGQKIGPPVSLEKYGDAELSIDTLAAGYRDIDAVYGGDGNYAGSTSETGGVDVDLPSTVITIANEAELSVPTVVGQPYSVQWNLYVTPPGSGSPIGTVKVTGGSDCSAEAPAGSCTLTSMTAGTKTLVATYGGSTDHLGSISPGVGHTVARAATTTTLASAVSAPVHGQRVRLTATVHVTAPGAGAPAGFVRFTDGTTVLCPAAPVNALHKATCYTSTLSTATHHLQAVYQGNANYRPSSSARLSLVVRRAQTATTVASLPNPSKAGAPVTLVARVTVKKPGSGVAAGMVQFWIDGTKAGAPVALAAGRATLAVKRPLAGGSHVVRANYFGATDFAPSQSTALTHKVVRR